MDLTVLDDLDTQVPERYPQVRSLLVVRHGDLLYERYWQGFGADDGQELHSITKSITSALVGIALGERYLKSLERTVGSCWPPTSPSTPTRECAPSRSGSC